MTSSPMKPPEGAASVVEVAETPFLAAFWTANDGMDVRLNISQIGSASVAGIVLADIMRHLVRALAASGISSSEEDAARDMFAMFGAEIDEPTDMGSGSFVN